jgi:hypothetical protein
MIGVHANEQTPLRTSTNLPQPVFRSCPSLGETILSI